MSDPHKLVVMVFIQCYANKNAVEGARWQIFIHLAKHRDIAGCFSRSCWTTPLIPGTALVFFFGCSFASDWASGKYEK